MTTRTMETKAAAYETADWPASGDGWENNGTGQRPRPRGKHSLTKLPVMSVTVV